jgi:acyl carrier protein
VHLGRKRCVRVNESIERLVLRTLSDHVRDSQQEIDPNVDLEDLGVDSLGRVSLLMELEEALGRTFPDEVLSPDNWRTVRSIVAAIQNI